MERLSVVVEEKDGWIQGYSTPVIPQYTSLVPLIALFCGVGCSSTEFLHDVVLILHLVLDVDHRHDAFF